ncbi:hypothetical protein EDD16DRAFT_1702879 [Pisolithus croceorrhizus]|nr:hypothetical protein EDD16DRAFT_1702879 [Pisolithus croceorrhizus]
MSSPKSPSRWKEYLGRREIRLSLPARIRALRPSQRSGAQPHRPDMLQTWSQWAAQKLTRNSSEVILVHEIDLFPGWATKRPRGLEPNQLDPFDIAVHISGVATSRRIPELLTPPQRTFLKFAKTFASLPKVQPNSANDLLEDGGLKLPPRPCEIPDNFELEDLDRRFIDSLNQTDVPSSDSIQLFSAQSAIETYAPAQLKRLHDNLESRLRPFWASLCSMPVQVSIFASSPDSPPGRAHHSRHPIITYELRPGSDGFFARTIIIPWEDIRAHPVASRIANDKASLEHELLVEAKVLSSEHLHISRAPRPALGWIPITHSTIRAISDIDDTVKLSRVIDGARAAFHNVFAKDLEETVIPEMAEWYQTLWKHGVRFHYVSNAPFELLPVVREFIKISGLPSGSIRLRSYTGKSLFNGILSAPATRKRANVVEVLDDFPQSKFILIGDSGEQDMELYARLAAERQGQVAGVFIRDVTSAGLQDPTGTQAADVLGYLPRSPRRASIALAPATSPVPRRSMTVDEFHSRTVPSQQPSRKSTFFPSSLPSSSKMAGDEISRGSLDSLGSGSFSVGSSTSLSSNSRRLTRRGTAAMTDGEKKQWDLQNRVYRARQLIPKHIPFRVFEDPKECVEVEQIMEQFAELGARPA